MDVIRYHGQMVKCRVNKYVSSYLSNAQCRARHWCLPHCPGQVEFVNYSCGGKWKLHLACPTGKVRFVYFWFTFENVCKFHGLASKLVLENMLSHARTMFYLGFKWNIIKLTIFQGQVKVGVGRKWKLNLTCPTGQVTAKVNVVPCTESYSYVQSLTLKCNLWIVVLNCDILKEKKSTNT